MDRKLGTRDSGLGIGVWTPTPDPACRLPVGSNRGVPFTCGAGGGKTGPARYLTFCRD